MSATKPVIFISYSHKDEPEHPQPGEIAWLSFVRTYLQPAIKHGVFDLFVDRHLPGGADWDAETEAKIRACDIFILLVSAHSMASDIIVDKEIAIIRERQARGEPVHFYPLLLTPTPAAALDKVKDKNIRPRDAKPFSQFAPHDRMQHMSDAADEIAAIATGIGERKSAAAAVLPPVRPTYVHISSLPETAYERLVGRDAELKRLDEAWEDKATNIISLIAEGGAGKSALVNEWLARMQAENYRGADAVLGWSFYSQGTKERATSADGFLNWALEKLSVAINTTSATAKGDAIAEALMSRRVLLVLDGVEPLQHGPDGQQGQLKDQGLRALLRRFAASPPAEAHGLIVLTSRLEVADIAGRKDGAAPVYNVEELSDDAGAALLRDNGVWGPEKELKHAARDFGGHPLGLGLLASFLTETQKGDLRRRDHIRAYLADPKNPRHDHAVRVMESYEREWLADQPELLAIMRLVGLFDRPATADCLNALRAEPVILNLTDTIVLLDEDRWQRAIARLRGVRLIAPPDPSAPDALDAHPLVREWFGAHLKETNIEAWKAAHGRLYEHLRDMTKEGDRPSLIQLMPLYQAIAHGCRADMHPEVLNEVYIGRISKRDSDRLIISYSTKMLGALSSNLAAVSWFFDKPYETPVNTLRQTDRSWVLNEAAMSLRAMVRLTEALSAMRAGLDTYEREELWNAAAIVSANLCETLLLAGNVAGAIESGETSLTYGERSTDARWMVTSCATLANALHTAGRFAEAIHLFEDAERRQGESEPGHRMLYSRRGIEYCDFLLAGKDYAAVRDRAQWALNISQRNGWLFSIALDTLNLARSHFGIAATASGTAIRDAARTAYVRFEEAVEALRMSGGLVDLTRGLFARAAFRRCVGDEVGASRDLDEAEEIAGLGPMKLHLCNLALERARLALAQIEAFAPLNGMIANSPPKPDILSEADCLSLNTYASQQLDIAAKLISDCGYHRRDEELAELQSVLRGERTFASLPIHV